MSESAQSHSVLAPVTGDSVTTMHWPREGESVEGDLSGSVYSVGELLGEGHYGRVWAATDCWGNKLALKVFRPERGTFAEVQQSALREISNLLVLRSPFVTHVYDAFVYRNACYIVTEQCDHTLADALENNWIGGAPSTIPIARSLLQGIHYIHSVGMVHKDLHLGNVMAARVQSDVSSDWALKFKIADLGISNLAEKIDPANTVLAGSILPPEMVDPFQFGPVIPMRIDQYHIGLLLLQVWVGQPLHFSEEEVLRGEPRMLAERIGGQEGAAIARALRRHTFHRFSDARAMWLALNGFAVD